MGTDKGVVGSSLGRISHHTAILAGHGRNVVRLLPVSLKAEYSVGETPSQAAIFINQFMTIKGDSPKANSEHGDGSILLTNISGQGWWALSLKT